MQENTGTTAPKVLQELKELQQNAQNYSALVKSKEYVEDYPVYDGDDVTLCPRCHDQDVTPGNRMCTSCRAEILADTA